MFYENISFGYNALARKNKITNKDLKGMYFDY